MPFERWLMVSYMCESREASGERKIKVVLITGDRSRPFGARPVQLPYRKARKSLTLGLTLIAAPQLFSIAVLSDLKSQ